MRFFQSLVLSLLPLTAFAAKKPVTDRFEEYHTKSLSSIPLTLVDSSFDRLTAAPRDYSILVLLTALEARFGCQLCHEFKSEWDLLAKSWTRGDKLAESRLAFGTLDFLDGKATFQSLGLQTAPVLLLFQPTTGPHAVQDSTPLRFDFSNGPQSAEQVHAWLVRYLTGRPNPPVKRSVNWMRGIIVTTILLGAITTISVAWPYLLPIIQNRNIWAAITLIAILLFTSGHMFNHIRRVPYVAGDGRGGVSYFAGGFSNQYGLETQIIAAICKSIAQDGGNVLTRSDGLLSFATISLALKVPRISDPRTQQIAVIVWGGVIFAVYSFLLSVFRIKNGGYPFWLPPFS
ncbi:MAG: oligosaccharyl transferase subunit ost3/OST6 [Claussenomyces sp. TS43310]|nr:MAG: oligosaccharyl transferase subunit ost3/OST6 [Claussenomyces sp. TS43310]